MNTSLPLLRAIFSSLPGFFLGLHCPGGVAGIAFSFDGPAALLPD
jgi:hypothetical protein